MPGGHGGERKRKQGEENGQATTEHGEGLLR